ncbi:MAG: hypothetical protein ABSG54_05885 [Terriglobia bacterium]|jgi:hypothetical protein
MNPTNHLVRLGIFFAVVLLAGGVAAQQKSSALSEDEGNALGATRTVNTAEVTYAATYGKGFSPDLLSLGEGPAGAAPSADHAALVAIELAKGKWGNYLFSYKPGAKGKDGKIAAYTLTVRPVKWQKDQVSYFTDQTGVIRWTKENRPPTAKDATIDSLPGV